MRMTGVLQPRFANFPKVREHRVAIRNMIIVLQHHNMSLSYRLQATAVPQVGTGDVQSDRLFSAPG